MSTIEELLADIADLEVKDQIRAVRDVLKSSAQTEEMLASPELTKWCHEHADTIHEMHREGEL